MYLENLLYTKFCAYCLEKKCSSLEEKSLVLYWLICVGVGAWDKHLASESQIFICKIIKSPKTHCHPDKQTLKFLSFWTNISLYQVGLIFSYL